MQRLLLLLLLLPVNLLFAQSIPCPPNLDFEQGNYDNWEFFTGTCCPLNTTLQSPTPVPGRHVITTGPAVDPYGGFPVVDPIGGVYSLKLGNNIAGGQAERVRYFLQVPPGLGRYILTYRYAVVFQDPDHLEKDQPRFVVNIYDSTTNDPLPCAQFTFVAQAGLPGFFPASGGTSVYYRPWTSGTFDLSDYGGKTIGIEFTSGDCELGAHFGYGYVDMNCELFQTYKVVCKANSTHVLEGPPGFEFYEWHDSLFTTNYGSGPNITIPTPAVTTTYAILVRPYNGFGCPDTFYTRVETFDYDVASFGIECGNEATLNINLHADDGPYTYFWEPANDLSCVTCASPVASPKKTTDYIVTVTTNTGCVLKDTMTLTVADIIWADISPIADTFCQYQSLILNDLAINPPDADYRWEIFYGNVTSGKETPHAIGYVPKEGEHMVVLEIHKDGCYERDTAFFYVRPSVIPAFSVNEHVCVGETVNIETPKQNASYHWSIDDWNISDTTYQNPIRLSWNTTGRKNISLKMFHENGCRPEEVSKSVNVHEFPLVDVFVQEKSVCLNDTINVSALESEGYLYEWKPVLSFLRNDQSKVKAIIGRDQFLSVRTYNRWGCSVYDSVFISPVNCCDIFFPDAFTPNGDGLNDKFHILSGGFQNINSFIIMNRWGQVIFKTNDQAAGWDGTFKGAPQDGGTYIYYIQYKCSDQQIFEKKGNLTLIR